MSEVPEELTHTRQTLLERLKNWEDRDAWQRFFDTYWKLIYSVSSRAGLNETEAREVVQDTVLTVSKKIKDFNYDPNVGRFRHWLLNVTKWEISKQLRRRRQEAERLLRFQHLPSADSSVQADGVPQLSVPPNMEALWDTEWQHHVMDLALQRLKAQVNPKHYQIFDFYVLKRWPMRKVTEAMGVNVGQVYMAKLRLSRILEKELNKLQNT